MARTRRSDAAVLLAAVALLGLGAWLLLFQDEATEDPGAALETAERPAARGTPRLLGAAGARVGPDEAKVDRPPTPEAATPRAARAVAPEQRLEVVRVLDATGQPFHRAQVTVRVKTASGTKRIRATTQLDGRASLRLPAGDVVRISVSFQGRALFDRRDERGIEVGDVGDIRGEDLYVLRVRTVDSTGAPRPAQRVLFRPREEGKQPTGWWGDTSDGEGWSRLGPYALGTRIELRPGPRGLEPEGVMDPTGWQEVRVDGTDVELLVGEVPRLRLAFRGAAPDARLWITVLDADTGKPFFPTARHVVENGIWTAEALAESARLEVVVLDRSRGRFARLRDVVPAGYPIDVALERGVRISGRVILPDATRAEQGGVTATGRGFQASTHVDARGRFRFEGLPDETLTLSARVVAGKRQYHGWIERTEEGDVRIPIGRTVRVSGRLVTEGVHPAPSPMTWVRIEATSTDWPGAHSKLDFLNRQFVFELPAGRWRLTARSTSMEGPALRGELDLGSLDADRKKVVLELREEGR